MRAHYNDVEIKDSFSLLNMELTFLGNKYSKTETISVKPTIQLKYMGKSYRAEHLPPIRNSVVLTYRGVSYAKG